MLRTYARRLGQTKWNMSKVSQTSWKSRAVNRYNRRFYLANGTCSGSEYRYCDPREFVEYRGDKTELLAALAPAKKWMSLSESVGNRSSRVEATPNMWNNAA